MTAKNRNDVEKKYQNIKAKYRKMGLSEKDISDAFSNVFKTERSFSIKINKKKFIFGFIIVAISAFVYHNWYLFTNDRCWIEMPNIITKATRPPEKCSMCSGITQVSRLGNLTPDEFEDGYAYNGVPIIVTDATTTWKAMELFDFWFFKHLYLETDIGRTARDCQFFPYKTEFHSLYDALEMEDERANLTKGTKSWYIGWSNCHDAVARVLRKYYNKPYFLPLSAENNAVDWIFMGGPGDGAQMHVDNVVHPSWQAQLKGRKKWTLAPPPECLYQCSFIEVVIHPGEIFVLDTNRWYHKTEILPGEISVTIGAEYD